MDYTLISHKDLINDYVTRYLPAGESIDESLFRSIADDTVYKIVGNSTKLFSMVWIDIKDFKGNLPKNYSVDIQAIFRFKEPIHKRVEITQMIQKIPGNNCSLEINLKCPACHQEKCSCGQIIAEIDVDRVWRMANPEYTAAASKFYSDSFNPLSYSRLGSSIMEEFRFKLMKRTRDNWFSMNYYLGDCVHLTDQDLVEYKIVNGKIITNFQEGEVILAYLGDHLDIDGYRMAPNNPRAIEAILTAVAHANMQKKFYTQLDQNTRLALQMLTQELELKISRARTQLNFPTYNEFISALQNDWRKMFNPLYWYKGGKASPDDYDPSNEYNFVSKL